MSRIPALLLAGIALTSLDARTQTEPNKPAEAGPSRQSPAKEAKEPEPEEREAKEQQDAKQAKPQRSDEEQEAYEERKAEIRRRIQTYRARMKSGETLKTNVKVRVKLRNEEVMTGVIKDGNFVEKPSGLEFVRAEMKTAGAGLRLWYYDNTDGYIFIPYTMIQTYKVLKELSEIEIKELRDKIVERERLARERGEQRKKELADKQQELREGGKTAEKLEELAKKLEADKASKEREAKLLALLEEFPAKEGWGEKKIQEINLRRITLKVFPNPKERRFIEVFEDWKLGLELAQKKADDPQTPGAKPEGSK